MAYTIVLWLSLLQSIKLSWFDNGEAEKIGFVPLKWKHLSKVSSKVNNLDFNCQRWASWSFCYFKPFLKNFFLFHTQTYRLNDTDKVDKNLLGQVCLLTLSPVLYLNFRVNGMSYRARWGLYWCRCVENISPSNFNSLYK